MVKQDLRRYHTLISSMCLVLLFWVAGPTLALPAGARTASILMVHSQNQYPAGGAYPIAFKIDIADGWTIHGTGHSQDGLIPTRLEFEPLPHIRIIGPWFPDPQKVKFNYTSEEVEVYTNVVLVRASLQIDEACQPDQIELKGCFSFQACSENVCRPPENISLSFPISIVPVGIPVNEMNQKYFAFSIPEKRRSMDSLGRWLSVGLWLTLLGIFLSGLALNLTPCIYPLIPITVSYFGGRSEKIRSRTIVHASVYLAGLAMTNSILGVSAALSGGMLGAVLQKPTVLIFLAVVMFGLALSFFGCWELRVPQVFTRAAAKSYKGYFGTFFMGLTLGIVAAPCLGPFILGLLTYVGQTGDPYLGFLYFFVLSIGMGLPLCILGVFSGALDRLPKSGEWMIWVRKIMGWVLVAVAAYIVRPLIPSTIFKDGLLFIVMIAGGMQLGWLDKSGSKTAQFAVLKKAVGLILSIAGISLLAYTMVPKRGVQWQPFHSHVLVEARQADKPVILDFYADWCLPCKELDNRIFSDPRVLQHSKEFITLRLDLTRRQPEQEDILRQFQVRGVPTVIFLNREGIELSNLRVEFYIDADEMIQRMRQALEMDKDRNVFFPVTSMAKQR